MKDFKKSSHPKGPRGSGFRTATHSGASHPLEMFKTTCAHCHKACEVPFRPNGKKPVFCKDCFDKDKTNTPATFSRSAAPSRAPYRSENRPTGGERHGDDLKSQVAALGFKLDALIRLVEGLKK